MKEATFTIDQVIALAERCAMYEASWNRELANKNSLIEANKGLTKLFSEKNEANVKLQTEVFELQKELKRVTRVVAGGVTVEKVLCELPKEFTTPAHFQEFYSMKLAPELGPIPSWFAEIQEYIINLKEKAIVPACKAFRLATGLGLGLSRSFIIWYAYKYHGVILGGESKIPLI